MARYHLSQALARTGQTADAQREMAEMLRQADIERLLEDVRVQPDNLELQIQAAEALLASGRADEGFLLLKKVMARDPGLPSALRLLTAYQGSGRAGPKERLNSDQKTE